MPVHRISSVTEWSTVDDARCNTFNLRKPQLFVCLCDCVFKLARSSLGSQRTHKIPFILYFSTDWFRFSNQSTNANKSTFAQTKTNTKPPQCVWNSSPSRCRLNLVGSSARYICRWYDRCMYFGICEWMWSTVQSQARDWTEKYFVYSCPTCFRSYMRARVYRNE